MPYFASYDQTNIYYESYAGKLPYTLIVLHGWAVGRVENYALFREYLGDFNLVFWDTRNHGKSEVRENATINDLARDLRFFLTDIYKESYPVIVAGHSMGALTLFEYVGKFGTDKISKMIFIDQSPKLLTDEEWKWGMFGNWTAKENEELIRALSTDIIKGLTFLATFFLNKEFLGLSYASSRFTLNNMPVVKADAARGLINIWRSFTARDFRPFVRKIDISVLLLYGAKSQFYLRETGEWMRDNIATSRLKIFPKGDHNPFLAEPTEVFQSIRNFVLE